jgi:inhibitor of cysteine peptidase
MRHKIAISIVCLLLVGTVLSVLQCCGSRSGPVATTELTKFSSYTELKNFLKESTQAYAQRGEGLGILKVFGSDALASESADGANGGYSTTNIQVAGVDEADIVKTDRQFIYLASENTIFIIKAYPPEEAQVLSKIELDETVVGLFINGDRLIVLENQGGIYATKEYWAEDTGPVVPTEPETCVKVYDVSDRESPTLKREIAVDGEYVGTRMVGDYVYAIVSKPAYEQDDEVSLPKIDLGNGATDIPAWEIYKCDVEDYGYMFTTIVAVNSQKDDEEAARQTLLIGASSNLYVSLENIYITSTRWLSDSGSEETAVHRIHIAEGEIEYQASGEFPGRVLNQFSIDEYQGVFRVATTTWEQAGSLRGATSQNNLYVLDANLDIVGKLENLAPRESIYSARFMGERCYLVTFQKVDPLFVIDLRDPYNPKVLGELKITGYSDYLHPYDENHIIGIGKEAVEAVEGDFAWYQGVKIALFDVSDVENPKEVAKYEIGDRGTDSEALRDHKAFLFDKSKGLLVLPILLAQIDPSKYPYPDPSAYGDYVWQGAYVFDISLEGGLQLEGRVTHYENDDALKQEGYYFGGPESVQRSLYIGDVLYTISQAKIKMNTLENLDYLNEVELQ